MYYTVFISHRSIRFHLNNFTVGRGSSFMRFILITIRIHTVPVLPSLRSLRFMQDYCTRLYIELLGFAVSSAFSRTFAKRFDLFRSLLLMAFSPFVCLLESQRLIHVANQQTILLFLYGDVAKFKGYIYCVVLERSSISAGRFNQFDNNHYVIRALSSDVSYGYFIDFIVNRTIQSQ